MSVLRWICFLLVAGCMPQEPLKIGYLGNLSGRNADLGVAGRNGALLAVEQYNASEHKGRPIMLVFRDDEGDPDKADARLVELKGEGVVAVIGPMLSSVALAVAPAADRVGLPVISPTVASVRLSAKDDLFFKVSSTTAECAEISVGDLVRRGLRRVGVAMDMSNAAFSEDWLSGFRAGLELNGGQLVAIEQFKSGQAEGYSDMIERLRGAKPDSLVFISNAVDTVQLTTLARKKGMSQPVMGSTWASTEQLLELGGRTVEGISIVQFFDREDNAPRYQEFRKAYMQRYQQVPDFASVAAYDATRGLLLAISEKKDGQSLKEALLSRGPFNGVQQEWSFDQFGDAKRKAFLTEVVDGKFVIKR